MEMRLHVLPVVLFEFKATCGIGPVRIERIYCVFSPGKSIMYRFSQIIVLYKILRSQKNTQNLYIMSTIVSDLSEVSSDELCLP